LALAGVPAGSPFVASTVNCVREKHRAEAQVEFHNIGAVWYHPAAMNPAVHTLLSRLRTSARLSAFVLIVFALTLGTAAACVEHDFTAAGTGTSTMQMADVSDDLTATSLAGSNTSNHCDCVHATALLSYSDFVVAVYSPQPASRHSILPPGTALSRELRPPIV